MGQTNVKFVQVIRNPYDVISIMRVRGKRTFENACDHYFSNCEMLVGLRAQLDRSNLLPIRYEDFVYQPETNLINICQFLGIEPSTEYLKACANIVRKSPDQSRHMIEWDPKWKEVVKNNIGRFDFLEGYSYDH